MQKYRCTYCEYIYDPVSGDPEHNVGRYTPFDALPDDWVCPVCGRGKWAFDAMKEQKTAKHNSVYISNKLRKTILEYVQQEFPDQLLQQDFDGYLFPSRKGTNEPLNRQSLWRIIHDAGTAIGLKDIGPHSMRKTFGYFLYKQGTKTEIIQSLLNHSSQRETLRYIGITQEDKDTAVKSLDL